MSLKLIDAFLLSKNYISSLGRLGAGAFNVSPVVNKKPRFFCDNKDNKDSENSKDSIGNKDSKDNEVNVDSIDRESKVKKLLKNSSPLKENLGSDKMWKSSPYIKGTVFQEDEEDKDKPKDSESCIIMFPGQGNQFVGMANHLINYSVVKEMFDVASEILKYDLLKLCLKGPEEKLNQTKFCQPALLVVSLAALEKLKHETAWAINNCIATCGFSLGEFAALVFAGCLSFEKAVSLVQLRAEAMQYCCDMVPGGMLTVLYGPGSNLPKALQEAEEHCKSIGVSDGICSVAIHLFPGCKVIGGHGEALNYLMQNSRKYGIRKFSKLPVSGAFHTNLVKEAAEPFKEAIKKVELKKPIIPVYSNVNGKPYKHEYEMKSKLPRQIYQSVKWEQTMQSIFERPKGELLPYSYECGPGNSLQTTLKKINKVAAKTCYCVKV